MDLGIFFESILNGGGMQNLWIENHLAIPSCVFAILLGMVYLFKSGRDTTIMLKSIVVFSILATIPLALEQAGIHIYLRDDFLFTYLNMFGLATVIISTIPSVFMNVQGEMSNDTSLGFTEPLPSYGLRKSDLISDTVNMQTDDILVKIKTRNKDLKTTKILKDTSVFNIGRAQDNDIVIDDNKVSRYHASVSVIPDGYRIEDKGSTNGTKVNGKKISDTNFIKTDTVRIGNTDLDFSQGLLINQRVPDIGITNFKTDQSIKNQVKTFVKPEPFVENIAWLTLISGPDAGESFKITKEMNTLGRSSSSDIKISDSYVSKEHARIKKNSDIFEIFDNASNSGVLVNNKKIASVKLPVRATLKLGNSELVLLPIDIQVKEDSIVTNDGTFDIKGEHQGAMMCVTKGPDAGKSMNIFEGKNLIGREANNGISLNDTSVSRKHCVVVKEGNEFWVYDLASESGTSIDGERVPGKYLNSGDYITLGKTRILFTKIDPLN